MSEHSESLHLWRRSAADARALAQRSKVSIRIVASNAAWTTVVPFEDDEADMLAHAVDGIALEWRFAADFALTLIFWESGLELGTIGWGWGENVPAKSPGLLEGLQVRGVVSGDVASKLAQYQSPAPEGAKKLGDEVAASLKLPAFEWLSPYYVRDTSLEMMRDLFPDAEDVEID